VGPQVTSPEITPPVERIIAADLLKRGAMVAPVALIAGAAVDGRNGVLTVAFALVIVLTNLALSAALLAWAAPKSPTLLMGTALGGFLGRMVIVGVAVWAVHDAAWVHMGLLGVAVLVTHLGLLAWETRYVSASLAFPALKPRGDS
jgi:hypothetical protein